MIKVYKFGGALLKDAEGIRLLPEIISKEKNEQLVIVISAISKSTNALENILHTVKIKQPEKTKILISQFKQVHITLATELFSNNLQTVVYYINRYIEQLEILLNKLPDDVYCAYDAVVSFGEKMAVLIVEEFLRQQGFSIKAVDAIQIIVTDSNFTSANINWKLTEKTVTARIIPALNKGNIVLTQGFAGADLKGNVTTLGREGSDFTAAVLSKCLHTKELTIWKNVPGFMNADPKRFPHAVQLKKLSYHDAIELAFYGASVVHPKTIQPLQDNNIRLLIRNYFHANAAPTVITSDSGEDEQIYKIIIKDNQCLLSISSPTLSFIAEENFKDIFEIFSYHKIHVNMMQNSAVSFSVCFDENSVKRDNVIVALEKKFPVKYNTGLTLYTLRNADDKLIKQFTAGKTIYLKQESRNTIRFLVKE